jgi:hypothetical protein
MSIDNRMAAEWGLPFPTEDYSTKGRLPFPAKGELSVDPRGSF